MPRFLGATPQAGPTPDAERETLVVHPKLRVGAADSPADRAAEETAERMVATGGPLGTAQRSGVAAGANAGGSATAAQADGVAVSAPLTDAIEAERVNGRPLDRGAFPGAVRAEPVDR
jgi:hypothetical protein